MSIEHMTPAQWKKYTTDKPKRAKKPGHVAEKKALKACLHWLSVHNILHHRQNTGAFEAKDKYGNPRWIAYGERGGGDIIGATKLRARYFEVECKATGGKQSPAQIAHQAKVEAAGGIYILAYSTDALHILLTA